MKKNYFKIALGSLIRDIKTQISDFIPILLRLYIPIIVLLLGFVFMQIYFGIEPKIFTSDPVQVLGGQPFTGFLSNLGILFWTATISITGFTSYFVRTLSSDKSKTEFLFYSSLFTTFLMLDDLFLLHEWILPDWLNIPETLTYLAYGLILVVYFRAFYKVFVNGEYVLFLLAIFLFGSSITFDLLSGFFKIPFQYLIEDGLKFVGIITWFLYFARISTYFLNLTFSKGKTNNVD